jgi:hypothetical protein
MKLLRWMSALSVLLLTFCARGQTAGFIYSAGAAGDGVTGAPYTANVVNEQNKVLLDGNRIHHETHGKMFRDSQGRTRTEIELGIFTGAHDWVSVFIVDPVQHVTINMNPQNKTATIIHMGQGVPPSQRAADIHTDKATPALARPGLQAAVGQTGLAGGGTRVEGPPKGTDMLRLAGLQEENLGSQVIDGLNVTGTRRTRTIPAGQMGNEKPMTQTFETWVSSDLHVVLLNKTDTPESGEYTTRLVNIQLGDPDPALFQIPADYKVEDKPE